MTTPKMQEIEERYGKPIKQVISDLYDKHQGEAAQQEAVAADMGISQPTLSLWLLRLGLKQTVVLTQEPAIQEVQPTT